NNLILVRTLRSTSKITTLGKLFKTKIDTLIAYSVFKFEVYNPNVYSSICIFKLRIVNEVKGKTTN
ncbi:hypothetical protein CC86DRAFT_309708, partial [Ophiobolus disseminans]